MKWYGTVLDEPLGFWIKCNVIEIYSQTTFRGNNFYLEANFTWNLLHL